MKLQVDDDRDSGGRGKLSEAELLVLFGEVLLELNISESLIEARLRGDRTTDPGVMLGSSSMLFNTLPFHGFPGSNSGTRSVNADEELACDEGQSFSESGQPVLFAFETLDDQGLKL